MHPEVISDPAPGRADLSPAGRLGDPKNTQAAWWGHRRPTHPRGNRSDWLYSASRLQRSVRFNETATYHFDISGLGQSAQEVYPRVELRIDGTVRGTVDLTPPTLTTFILVTNLTAGTQTAPAAVQDLAALRPAVVNAPAPWSAVTQRQRSHRFPVGLRGEVSRNADTGRRTQSGDSVRTPSPQSKTWRSFEVSEPILRVGSRTVHS